MSSQNSAGVENLDPLWVFMSQAVNFIAAHYIKSDFTYGSRIPKTKHAV